MSSVQEIQEAIARLPESQRLVLIDWIHTRENDGVMENDPRLLADAAEGERQLDAGSGSSLDDVRRLTSQWTTR